MMSNQSQGPSLSIVAVNATDLKNVELIGKQDPYLRFSLDITNPKSFQKTFVHKDAGKNPVWNQSFNVPLNGEAELYIEIMDEETTADSVIAFAAIPISQVVNAPGGALNGVFDVYSTDGKQSGQVNLTLTAQNVPGQNAGYGSASSQTVRGESHVVDAHLKRIKSIKNKEIGADAGMAIAGGLFALGAGLLANKVIGDEKKKEQARKDAAIHAEEERSEFETEKRTLEEQRSTFERTQNEQRATLEREQQEFRSQQQNRGESHSERREEHCESRKEHHGERREEHCDNRKEHHGEHREEHHKGHEHKHGHCE